MGGWRHAGQAALILGLALLLVLGVSRVLALPNWLPLYQNQFAFTPGDWFAWRIGSAGPRHEESCIFVGASTVREGFDPVRIAAETGIETYNFGVTGGHSAIDAIDIQANTLAARGERYKCVVVGLHSILLRKIVPSAYDLVVTDYAAVLPLDGLFGLAQPMTALPSLDQVIYKYAMPMAQHSLVLTRLLRKGLLDLHRSAGDAGMPASRYELFEGEFTPQGDYLYRQPSVLADIEESYRAQIGQIGWEEPRNFGGQVEADALRSALSRFSEITDKLIVVRMPESYLFDDVRGVAEASFQAALEAVTADFTYVRCSVKPERQLALFHDAIHLNADGRRILSDSIAPFVDGTAGRAEGICEMVHPASKSP